MRAARLIRTREIIATANGVNPKAWAYFNSFFALHSVSAKEIFDLQFRELHLMPFFPISSSRAKIYLLGTYSQHKFFIYLKINLTIRLY